MLEEGVMIKEKVPSFNEYGVETRVSLFNTSMKYSKIRVVEKYKDRELINSAVMVADHLIVKIIGPISENDFLNNIRELDAHLIKILPLSQLHIIGFDMDKFESIKAALKENPHLRVTSDRIVNLL